ELATLGTRFFRASNAVEAEIGGTGLGLRIVQTIADNHGGRLEIDSTEGQGTTARLVVPAVGEANHRNIEQRQGITQG
ncbi:MAG TPA: ATP-binding protein, partial [Nocardioidaceae bacterium]|nr:ATP-binding protein [Nocardioidaceae bacterium]